MSSQGQPPSHSTIIMPKYFRAPAPLLCNYVICEGYCTLPLHTITFVTTIFYFFFTMIDNNAFCFNKCNCGIRSGVKKKKKSFSNSVK